MTDDCPIPFGTSRQLPPDLLPLGFLWNYQGNDLQLCLTFTEDMDTGETPSASAFVIEVDATDKVPDSVQWLNNRVFQLNYNEASLGPVAVRCILDESQPAFHAVGFQPVSPFDILGAKQVMAAEWIDSDPDVEIAIASNFPMIQVTTPAESPWTVSWSSFSAQPDDASFQGATDIELIIDDEFPPAGPVNVELTVVNVDYKHTDGRWICPFLLSNIPEQL